MAKKTYEQYPGETNQETTDAAAQSGSDHNEALAQRPDANADQLVKQSETSAKTLRQGEKTTTTPDSATGQTLIAGQNVGDLDTMSAEDKLNHIRGWGSRNRLGGPRQGDWEEFDALVGTEDHNARSRGTQTADAGVTADNATADNRRP